MTAAMTMALAALLAVGGLHCFAFGGRCCACLCAACGRGWLL